MARRSKYGSKYGRKRGGKFKKGQGLVRQVKALQTQVKKLAKETKPELKYLDTINANNAPDTGVIVNLASVVQGTDVGNRIGDVIRVRKIWGRMHLDRDASTDTSVRFILFKDRQPNGVPPTVNQLLQTVNFQSPLNMDYRERFQVYRDKTYTLNQSKNDTLDPKISKSINFTAQYGSPTANVPISDGLFALYMSNRNGLNVPTVDTYWRMRFTDV